MLRSQIIALDKKREAVFWVLLDKHEKQQEEDIWKSEHHVQRNKFYSKVSESFFQFAANNSAQQRHWHLQDRSYWRYLSFDDKFQKRTHLFLWKPYRLNQCLHDWEYWGQDYRKGRKWKKSQKRFLFLFFLGQLGEPVLQTSIRKINVIFLQQIVKNRNTKKVKITVKADQEHFWTVLNEGTAAESAIEIAFSEFIFIEFRINCKRDPNQRWLALQLQLQEWDS